MEMQGATVFFSLLANLEKLVVAGSPAGQTAQKGSVSGALKLLDENF